MNRENIIRMAQECQLIGMRPHLDGIYQESLERFAQLIVKECVTVLNNRFMGDMNREDLEVRRCIADVKQHFGVE